MAYVEVLRLNPGQTVNDAIETYLNLQLQGLTNDYTVVDVNGREYPIGFFDDNTIDLFKLGVTTIDNISFLIGKGHEEFDEAYKQQTDYFVEQLLEKYDKSEKIELIIDSFSRIAEANGQTLLDQDQKRTLEEKLKESSMENKSK